jgi:hypothetical protein
MREEDYQVSGTGPKAARNSDKKRGMFVYPVRGRARRRFARDFRRVLNGLKDHILRETYAAAAVENYYYGDVEVGEFREPVKVNLPDVVQKGLRYGGLIIAF